MHAQSARQYSFFAAVLYALLIIYGSLFPLSGWQTPEASPFSFMHQEFPKRFSRSDIILNIMVYMPLGLFLSMHLFKKRGVLVAVLCALCAGIALSFSMETAQAWLPHRTSSVVDLLTNSVGTAIGAVLIVFWDKSGFVGVHAYRFRDAFFLQGNASHLTMTVCILWALSQLSPFVPSLGRSNLIFGLKPLWFAILDPQSISGTKVLVYTSYLSGLGLLILAVSRDTWRGVLVFLAFIFCVFALKIPVVSRQVSMESVAGFIAAVVILTLLHKARPRLRSVIGIVLLVVGFYWAQVDASGSIGQYMPMQFNWIPFKGHLVNIVGLANILGSLWLFMALAVFTMHTLPKHAHGPAWFAGGIVVGIYVFWLEWLQRTIPGRVADITDVLLALAGWCIAWFILRSEDSLSS